jgi:hypothetical protein
LTLEHNLGNSVCWDLSVAMVGENSVADMLCWRLVGGGCFVGDWSEWGGFVSDGCCLEGSKGGHWVW